MQQVTIKSDVWVDSRFERLRAALDWSKADVLGTLTFLWAYTRSRECGPRPEAAQVRAALAHCYPAEGPVMAALLDAGYLVQHGELFEVVDNAPYFALTAKLQEAGKRGGYRKHKTRRVKKSTKVKLPATTPTNETWEAYRVTYMQRYGVEPLRNGRVNGQLAQLVGCVGKDDAPKLVRWYLRHNGSYYVRCQHPVGALLKDCEGLHTQMLRNEHVTETDVSARATNERLEAQLRRLGNA